MSETVTASAPAPEPVATTPAPAPVAAPEPVAAAPAPAEPVVAAPAAEPVAEPAAIKLHTDTPSLLEEAGKPADPAKAADAPAATPQPAPTAYEFKFPETFKAEPAQLDQLTGILSAHGVPQEQAQALVDMHTAALTRFAENTLAAQHEAFATTRAGWRDAIKADPELGGAGFQTAQAAIARMRDKMVPEAHRAEFNDFLRVTGAGDHPAFHRLLRQAARIFDEPAMPVQPHGPPASNGRAPGRAGIASIYDHPTSQRRAG